MKPYLSLGVLSWTHRPTQPIVNPDFAFKRLILETTKRTIELVKEQIGHNIPVSGKVRLHTIQYIIFTVSYILKLTFFNSSQPLIQLDTSPKSRMNVILLNETCTNSAPCSNKKFVHAVKSLSLLHLHPGLVQYDEKGNGWFLRKFQSFQSP